jgi:hypothetical protein
MLQQTLYQLGKCLNKKHFSSQYMMAMFLLEHPRFLLDSQYRMRIQPLRMCHQRKHPNNLNLAFLMLLRNFQQDTSCKKKIQR